ncbi:MAG: hypothetical protein ACM3UV_03395, partial [Nocardioidaceae bacterium]
DKAREDGDWAAALRDMRAMIVALAGLVVVVLVVLIALGSLPGPVPQGQLETKTPAVQAIAGAAISAVASVVAAYFGIRAAGAARDTANEARKDSHDMLQQVSAENSALNRVLPQNLADSARNEVYSEMKRRGLG